MRLRALLGTIVFAACVYVFDALVVGQGVIGVVVFSIALVAGGIKTLIAAHRKDQAQVRLRAARIGVYFVMALAIFATIYINNRIAAHRAEAVIAACRRYQAKYHLLPGQLRELVPEFLPNVPKAKYTLDFGDFVYSSTQESHRLSYTVFPPFLRTSYSFEANRWTTRD
jgi:hypothetical protein